MMTADINLTPENKPSRADKIARSIPVIGWLAKCLEEERAGALGIFALNVALAVIVATLIWGFPAFIATFLGLTGIIFVLLVLVTRG